MGIIFKYTFTKVNILRNCAFFLKQNLSSDRSSWTDSEGNILLIARFLIYASLFKIIHGLKEYNLYHSLMKIINPYVNVENINAIKPWF